MVYLCGHKITKLKIVMNQLSSITPLEIILIALAAVGIFFFFRACWRIIKRSRQHLSVALLTLMMSLTAQTAWAGTVDVTVNVTGSGSVSIGNQTATEGNPFTTSVDDGASVTLTIAPDAGNIVTSAKLSYKPSEDGTAVDDIAISGSTATFQMPNDIWNGTGVTINVTFGAGLVGGADEASAVALTDATVSNLAGGYYKVESDISFDHTLNLIGNTYLVIASGAKMTVSSSEYGINGELYALNVLGEGTLNVTTTGSYKIAVCVSSYTQSGCSVNLTTSFMGMRCSDSFNISGGSFKTNGSEGIWPDNAVNISGGKLEASNIDANINLSYSNTDDYIKVDNYTSGKTMTIANGQTFTDGTTNYSGTITNLSPLNGKKLFPFVYMHLTVRDATCTEVGIKQECWQRSSDGKYFSDENGTNELNASDVEIPMIAHNGIPHEATDTHIAYWQCSVCSKYFSNSGCTTEITEEDTKIYRTITIDDGIRDYVTSNVDKAVAGTTVTLTVSHLINASTLQVNGGSVTLTDAGNGTYTFTVPAADVTVTASTATTYSVNLPANMEIVSATTTADGDGKYISGTVVTFKASFSYTASNVSDGANTLTADGSGNYSVTVGTADITVTATIGHSSNIDLSQAPSDFTVVDGDVLTGSTSHTVTIANNAKITLSNATISGGIVCDGTAEITLVGTNSVSNTWYSSAGIQIGGSGTTLTIKGDGSLTATGGSQAAGIGLGRTWDANATGGSVVIEGGTVTASGGNGIGTGTVGNSMTAHMDGIIIKGGTVNARLGKGTINNGSSVTIGTIKIYDGIEKVDASTITESVTYMHVENETETDVTATASTYFTIIEDGDRRVITQKDDTDYTITIADNLDHGTIAYAATTAKYGEKITITATPDFGYRLSRLVVKDTQNNSVASTGNSFFMPKSNVTVSAVFEEGTHGTTEFAWGYLGPDGFVTEASIYDGLTTVNLQQGQSSQILKYDNYSYRKFLLDNDTYNVTIPYSGGTGTFTDGNGTDFRVDDNGESGYYDITMTDAGNGRWNVSILKTASQMDVVPDQTYTGSEITPEPLVLAGSLNLTKGTDYVYSYTNNTNFGTATVRATFQGDYASLGYVEKEFTILPPPVVVNVTGNGTVTYNDKVATNGEVIGVVADKGTDVTLTLTPENGYAVRSVAYGYTNNSGTTASGLKLPINGTTATLTVPNDLKDGTYVTMTVSFVSALAGGADEASAVALTDATVTDLGGGWYKVDSDITFDHTLNLLGDTHLIIDNGKTMTVNTASNRGIDSDYTLTVSGAGALNVTTTSSGVAVRVGNYVQTGATVTASGYIGIRCTDDFIAFNFDNDFTFSGGQLTATGNSGGIWADNDITLSCTNATDFIQASSYSSAFGAVKIADGKVLTDGTEASNGMNGYSGTLTNEQITAIGGKTLHRAVTTSYVDASGTLHENVIAIPLDDTMTTLAAGWYVVNSNVAYTGQITLNGDVNLILGDGKTMTVTNTGTDVKDRAIYGDEKTLHIYGQSQGTGALTATAVGGESAIFLGISDDNAGSLLGIHGGVVSASTECASGVAISVQCATDAGGIVIDGGQVTASGKSYGIFCFSGHFDVIGGQVTATGTNGYGLGICDYGTNPGVLTLGYSKASDFVSTNSIYNYSGESSAGEVKIADDQTLVDGNGNIWSGTLSNDEIQSIRNQTLRPVTGVALTKDVNGTTATFSGTSADELNIPVAVEVDHVDVDRTFAANKACTLYLPFGIAASKVSGGKFYTFTTVNESTTPWSVEYDEVTGDIVANTPYIFLPDGTNAGKIVVDNGSDKVSVSTANPHTTVQGQWEFIGTYEPIQWLSDNERAAEIGKIYGFAAKDKTVGETSYTVGQFVKIASGASIKPMRAYLKRTTVSGTRTMTRGVDDSLPSTMTVVLKGSSGNTTEIGTISLDDEAGEWYSLDGRKLSGKPTKKGLYINGGKKIVIK